MIVVYLLLAAALVFFSYRSFRGGLDYLNYFKQELAKTPSDFVPFATVIAPCKGLDEGLAENLNALLIQDYPSYEVLFVVDDVNDAAVKVIREISREGSRSTKMVVASRSTESGQKVENLRAAVLHADERSEIFVFVDSDVRAGEQWLRSLAAPLANDGVGAATGYRWFVSDKTNFATELRSAWNASIASALGPNTRSNFCWGGSTAIRRKVFERLNIREKWLGTLSDDFAVTRAISEAGLPIHHVPRAIVPSAGGCSMFGLFEFTNRQMKITRVYARKLWLMSFFGSALFNAVMIASAAILIFSSAASLLWVAAILTLISITLLSIGKAWLRLRAIRMVVPSPAVDGQAAWQMTLWALTPAVFFVNCVAALFSTAIRWRGIEYRMISPTSTTVSECHNR